MSNQPKILQNTAKRSLRPPAVKDIHINAELLIQQSVEEYENDLRLQANMLAKNDELVLVSGAKVGMSLESSKARE